MATIAQGITCLLVKTLLAATWCGVAQAGRPSETSELMPAHHHNQQRPANWQLYWRPGKTRPPRRVIPVRHNYWEPACEPWLECVHSQGLAAGLGETPWPRGTKVLFLGNSFVRQLAETAILNLREGAIQSMSYQAQLDTRKKTRNPCKAFCPILRDDSGGYRSSCELVDLLTAPLPKLDGVNYCTNWVQLDKAACNDDAAVVRLYDGGILAQLINHSAQLLPLDVAVPLILGIPLSEFDVVVANEGNPADLSLAKCPGPVEGEAMREAFREYHHEDKRQLQVANVTSALARGGFRGHLFQVSTIAYEAIPDDVKASLQRAKTAGLGFSMHASSVLDAEKMRYEAVDTCGQARVHGSNHACMPGPMLWMVEALRADYAARVQARS